MNRVSLIGYLNDEPQIMAAKTTYEHIVLDVVTRDLCCDICGIQRPMRREHKVIIIDEIIKEYVQLFMQKGSNVFIEGQLGHVSNTQPGNGNLPETVINAEIIVGPPYGCLRCLHEKPVTEFSE
ncbi:MAG: hypothetical protein ABFQ95_07185 [Pseudomonadota bacterium]